MSSRPELHLDWCGHDAARYAVTHWHYSRSLPTPPLVKIGVWEDRQFVGCVLFSRGASNKLGHPYGLTTIQVCELTRVALARHRSPVSRIIAIAVRFLRQRSPALRLIVSFADPNHGHHGGIYQAGGWIYTGQTAPSALYIDRQGREWHPRQVSATGVTPQYGQPRRAPRPDECRKIPQLGKHRYLYPLDPAMRDQLTPLAQLYPSRPRSVGSDAPADHVGEGGAMPTLGLHDETDPSIAC